MGICWDAGAFDYYIQNYWKMQPITVLFVPGNHENYPEIMRHPFVDTPWGDKAYQITENVYCLRRGGYYTIEGKTFFTFGGARSHDILCRKEGKTWWKEELPTGEECEYGFEVLAAHSNKADFLITHCADDILLHKIEAVIAADKLGDSTQRYQFTAYRWNGTAWAACDGNYSASNVYFDEDFTFTKAIGTVTIPSSGSQVVAATGKNLKEFFAGLFAQEQNPTMTQPTATLNSSNIGAKEVGENVALNFSFATNPGSYSYGPSTGVTFSNHSATFNGENKTGTSGTFTTYQVKDGDNLTITGSCESSQGAMPKTNIGNDYPAGRIAAKTFSNLTKGTLTGYRAWFCGYKNGTNALANPTAITGAEIRALGNSANGSWKSQMNVSQMKQMFFAAPAGKGYKPAVKDHSTTAPQTVQGPITVYVKGANNYVTEDAPNGMAYDVWYVANADAASGSATLDISWA